LPIRNEIKCRPEKTSSKEIEFLLVHRQYRKLSVATALIEHMFTLFPQVSHLTVVTYRENDEKGKAARELYERIGFAPRRLFKAFDYQCQEFSYTTK
jgi:ribosomal protein S18 acetylase RimI-like enzyme